jgi:poly-gamma-glutamate synthesis protein (capsule biosynthesis protein)
LYEEEDFMKLLRATFALTFVWCLFFVLPGWPQSSSDEDLFAMALTGDAIISRKLSVYQEPEFLQMIELIRSADVAFTNLETLFHDYEPFPMHQSGGTYMRAEPALAKELAWAGFDMVSRANNHSGDYGVLGMKLTTRYVEEAGLVHAGVGESLAAAREARFLETAEARAALVACASSFPDHARAGKTRGDIPTRPGLNPLRYSTTYVVTEDQFEVLMQMHKELRMPEPEKKDELRIFRQRFIKGEKPEIRTEPRKEDMEEIASVVRNASRLADYTIVSIHAHEQDKEKFVPAKFLVSFAHAMIDAGADVLVGHGPHILRGIEIYKGKPIFYSLGNFIFQNETLLRLPYENYQRYKLGPNKHVADFNDARYESDKKGFPAKAEYWESVIAVPHWKGRRLVEIRLYPITLGFGKPRQVRGRPLFADSTLGAKILKRLARYSKAFGTRVEVEDNIGVVRID